MFTLTAVWLLALQPAVNLRQAYYEALFENDFLRSKGDAFQCLFERVMGLAYRSDFMACRPWGNRGDRKNDGYLKSERTLFQVYAPNEMSEKEAIAKISEDFDGARTHWGKYFDRWVFVHNADGGRLPPHVQTTLLEFEALNAGINIVPWTLPELKLVFRKVPGDDLELWYGAVPSDETKLKLGFKDLQVVLESIGQRASPAGQSVKDVPMGKIEANALSDSVAFLLKTGMTKAPLVESFFAAWHEPTLGERIAKSFHEEYERLSSQHMPNRIFAELQAWAGGVERGTPEHQLAVLTVMAYYFERCDIFKEPLGHR